MAKNKILLKWPATLLERSYPFGEEVLDVADPKFFEKLRKAFRKGMTSINAVSINLGKPKKPATKE